MLPEQVVEKLTQFLQRKTIMTKLELIEAWIAKKGNEPYTFADLVDLVDTASQIGASLHQEKIMELLTTEIKKNAVVTDARMLGELIVPNVGLMDALNMISVNDIGR